MAGFPTSPLPGVDYNALFSQLNAAPQQRQFAPTGAPSQANMFGGATGVGAMFGPIGAAAGMGLEFLGANMAANAGVSRRTVRRRGKAALALGKSQDALFSGLERAELLKGQADERKGFEGARKALETGGVVAKQGLQTRAAQNRAALEQSVISKGLLGTTPAAQAFAGVGDQYAMQAGMIDAQLAQAFANLGLEEGQMLGQQGLQRTALAAKDRARAQDFSEAEFGLLTMA